MLSLAERIAKDFRLVRIDCYYIGDKIYIGELTLTPNAGLLRWTPPEWDSRLGDKLSL